MSKSNVNLDEFAEIVKQCTGKDGLINWGMVTINCNKKFGRAAGNDTWHARYDNMLKLQNLSEDKVEHDYNKIKEALLEVLKKPTFMSVLEKTLELSKYELLGLISEINSDGLYQITEGMGGYCINKNPAQPKRVYVQDIGNVTEIDLMIVSDSHMGSIYEQVPFLNYLYDLAVKRGITRVYHVGDIADGHYVKKREQQLYALKYIGFEAQSQHIIEEYPFREGIVTYFILGNHDETFIQCGGANIGRAISRARPDMKYLGTGAARVMLTKNCSMDLLHPLDGSTYALSYAGQKYMDALTGGDKPNILLVGHHHKAMAMFYRNIHYFEVPSTCLQSDWEKRMRINNTAGAWILHIKVDEEGTVVSITSEFIPHYSKKEI